MSSVQHFCLCVNDQRFKHTQIVEEANLDPVLWLEKTPIFPKMYLKTENQTRAACGSILSYHDLPKYAEDNTSTLGFYGGSRFPAPKPGAFSPWTNFPHSLFFAPHKEFIATQATTKLLTHNLSQALLCPPLIIQKKTDPFNQGKFLWDQMTHIPDRNQWESLITQTVQEIKNDYYQKIVHTRLTEVPIQGVIFPTRLLHQMEKQYMSGALFFIQFSPQEAFLGITPEKLFHRKERTITVDALAGTAALSKTSFSLAPLETASVYNEKNYQEFLFVKSSIESSLYKLVKNGSWNQQDCVKNVGSVQHLYNEYHASLPPSMGDREIISSLHPTAAIGGLPQQLTLNLLSKIAYFDRGWYSAPIGYLTPREAEFYVAIRSALLQPKSLFLFAGAGITKDSVPKEEWDELDHKTQVYRGNFGPNLGKTFS